MISCQTEYRIHALQYIFENFTC